MTDADKAYQEGLAVAGATLVGVVAAELGSDHPLIQIMVERLGHIAAGHTYDP